MGKQLIWLSCERGAERGLEQAKSVTSPVQPNISLVDPSSLPGDVSEVQRNSSPNCVKIAVC